MHLPTDAFSCRYVRGRVIPRWLTERDEDFVTKVLETIASFDGLTVGEAELVAERFFPNRMAEGIWLLERRRWTTALDAPIPPETVREVVFEAAAKMPRADALQHAADQLGASVDVLVGSLFADRSSQRRLRAPEPASPAEVIARFNLAVVQTLLSRAMEVEAVLVGDARTIAKTAKRNGLVVQLSAVGDRGEERVRIQLAGPLALFHDTAKYGRSLARFVPSLVALPGWALRATVLVGGQRAELVLSEDDGVLFAGTIATAAADPIAYRLLRDLHKGGVRVNLAPPLLHLGERLIVTDFALEWGERRIYVDILPFATAEQLASKLAQVAQLEVPMLLCVQEGSAGANRSSLVVPYRRSIDPWKLLEAARNLLTENAA